MMNKQESALPTTTEEILVGLKKQVQRVFMDAGSTIAEIKLANALCVLIDVVEHEVRARNASQQTQAS